MSAKKNIIYVGAFKFPDKNAAASRALSLNSVFCANGYAVHYIGRSTEVELGKVKCNIEVSRKTKTNIYEIGWHPFHSLFSIGDIKCLMEQVGVESIHTIILYNFPSVALLRVLFYCKRSGINVVADTTEWYSSSGGGFVFSCIKWADTAFRMHVVNKRLDGLLLTSDYLMRFYSNIASKTFHLPTLIARDISLSAASKSMESGTFTMCYAGSAFNPKRINKNRSNVKDRLDLVIEILYAVELSNSQLEWRLNIFGLSKSDFLRAFPILSDEISELSKKVRFHGIVDRNVVVSAIENSDFTIFLRKPDRVNLAGFPTKFSESIALGIPSITNKLSNIEKYFDEGDSGFYIDIEASIDVQAVQLSKVISTKREKIERMKEFCKAYENLDPKKFGDELCVFLDKL